MPRISALLISGEAGVTRAVASCRQQHHRGAIFQYARRLTNAAPFSFDDKTFSWTMDP